MRGMQKSKRISWASDVNLCQVKLFLSDESPSQVGVGGQDHLQAKASWLHSAGSDDNLPPGFEGIQPANLLRNKLSQIPRIKWKYPSRFVLNRTWQVVAGEESKEVELENQREMRVLEAVYPRPSAIPPNPALLMSIEDTSHNDQQIPLIPITPIEDEDAGADSSFDNSACNTLPMSSQPQISALASQPSVVRDLHHHPNSMPPIGTIPGVEPEAVSAAYSALTAALSNNDQANLIDPNLLVKILSNPELIEKLVTTHGAAANPQILANSTTPGMPLAEALPPVHTNTPHVPPYSLAASSSGTFYPPPSRVGPVPVSNLQLPPPPEVIPSLSPPLGAPVKKDINYYKSLIQQHGGDNQETTKTPKPRDMKPKIMKPCIYFNSSRGCRHGANCAYQHDSSSQQRVSSLPEAQSAKRMKMDREITGT